MRPQKLRKGSEPMRILFMGTPDFAVASLRRLGADGHEVCGVFTQPDKPKNRGHKLVPTPVKGFALTENIPVYQPLKMRDGTALELVQSLAPELTVVAAYGRILPEDILEAPRYGSINVHSSLLPKYRGAAPINWAILNGEETTGVSIMYMAKELDAGDVILQKETPIGPDEDAQALTARLADLGAEALSEAVAAIGNGTAARTPQDESRQTYASMLTKEMSPIDWTRSAREIDCQVRGLIPWPCAACELAGQRFPGLPVFLLGHSMGSFLARTYLIRYPGTVAGAILMGTGQMPPALVADISTNGICMTGGGSLVWGFDKLIESHTGIETHVADDAISCVAYGTGKSLDDVDSMHSRTFQKNLWRAAGNGRPPRSIL